MLKFLKENRIMYYMNKINKKILTFVAAGCILLLIGCIGEEKPTIEKLTAEQVRDNSLEAMQKVDTYAIDVDIDMLMKGGEVSMLGAKEMTMSVQGEGRVDEGNRKMQMKMTMLISGMSMDMEQYIIGDTQYMKIPMLGWVKNRTSEDVWEKQSYAKLEGDLMKGVGVKFLEDEKVDGLDCYVLEVEVDDVDKMLEVMSQQMGTATSLNAEEMDSIKGIGFKNWIAKDTFLTKKIFMSLQMEKEGALMDMNMTMKLYDHGNPMEITLPEEAKDAVDMESMREGMITTT